jgi:hypothetical protein
MTGFSRFLRVFLASLILLAFSTLVTAGVCLAVSESEAESKVGEAEVAVSSAYVAVLDAEKSGADVSGLLMNLTYAGEFLAEAQTCYRNGDFGGAVYYADLSVRSVDGLVGEAGRLKALAMDEYKERVFQTVAGSGVAVGVIVLVSVVGWLLLKRRYFEKVVKMKPEVV